LKRFNPSSIFHAQHSIFKRISVDLNKKKIFHSLALFTLPPLPPPPPPPPRGGLKFLLVVEETTTTAGWTTPANEEEEEKDDPVSSPFAKMVKRAAEEAKTLVCGGEVELR
jgi:hypothetical protein